MCLQDPPGTAVTHLKMIVQMEVNYVLDHGWQLRKETVQPQWPGRQETLVHLGMPRLVG